MKKSIMVSLFVFAIATVSFSGTSFGAAPTPKTIIPVQLNYIGNLKNGPLFQLIVNGSNEDNEFILEIKDQDGFSFYRETIKASYSKKFLLNTDELGSSTLRFEITSKKSNRSVIYQVNRHTKQVEEMLITKL